MRTNIAFGDKEDDKKKFEKIVKGCSSLTDTNRCDAAEKIWACFEDGTVKNGLSLN
jgi:hypothetical protein